LIRCAGFIVGLALSLGACAGQHQSGAYGSTEEINVFPTNYKTDIQAAMHVYLNDPTDIRDAMISEPVLKPATVAIPGRYVACLRFNAKRTATVYAGMKEIAAVFLAGRFDQFIDSPKEEQELCVNAAYTPFPELQTLSRY
jgi:hypothetical protein